MTALTPRARALQALFEAELCVIAACDYPGDKEADWLRHTFQRMRYMLYDLTDWGSREEEEEDLDDLLAEERRGP